MAHAPSITSVDGSAFDGYSIELSLRSSQISRPDPVRTKRRLQDILDRHERRRPLRPLSVSQSSTFCFFRYGLTRQRRCQKQSKQM